MAGPAATASETERFATDCRYIFGIADMAALNAVLFRQSWLRWMLTAVFLVTALACVVTAAKSVAAADYTAAALEAGWFLLLGALVWGCPEVFAWLLAAVWWLGRKSSSMLLPTEAELSPEGVRARSDATDLDCRWSGIRRVVRRRDHLFLFMTDRVAFIVPRRAFTTAERFAAFCDAATRLWQRAAQAPDRA